MLKPRERIIKLLLHLLAHPYRNSKRDLGQYFGVSSDTIKDDLYILKQIGLQVEHNTHYRYAVLPQKEFKELTYLQPLTEEDKAKIDRALQYISGNDALYIRKKLASLYDFQQLGIRALRKPALERIDQLSKANKEKQQVILENYRSRSNNIRNRTVEPFLIDPEKDTLQAFDIENKENRHYRLSRIERVRVLDQPWQFGNLHQNKITDVFRIADNNQISVHLLIDVFAYNSLTEEFPLTLTYLVPGSKPNTYDFQCRVNHDFKGLLNFIMANARHVNILSPTSLKDRLKTEAEAILKNM